MALRDTVTPGFQLVWGTALKNVEAMPESGLEFKPAGLETRSFREIALHMANATVTFGENIGKGTWERIAAYPPDKIKGKAPVLESMRQAGERFLASLPRLTDQETTRVVLTPWGVEMPQGQIVMGHVPHMFYHNGQMTIYLRMQGIKPHFLAR